MFFFTGEHILIILRNKLLFVFVNSTFTPPPAHFYY